ncbi:MAG: glycoside hydrolase family 30 beta sandwich domain-containing protein [Saprospiraceae bacterium]
MPHFLYRYLKNDLHNLTSYFVKMIIKKIYLLIPTLLLVSILLFQFSCGDDAIPIPPNTETENENPEGKVAVWRSDQAGLIKLAKEPTLLPYETVTDADVNITIEEGTAYQTMEGFGAALTHSSAFVIQTHLEEAEQNQLLEDLFDTENGIGISYIRLTIGASDFSIADFTYNDLAAGESDIAQNNFNLSMEDEYLIPLLQKILTINPAIKIMASPWSAPAWMKENETLKGGGHLKTDFQASYANYFIKYIQAMEAKNIPIHAITIQNEPLYAAPYISMEMSAAEQKSFIRDHLGPQFEANNITTKIIIYDHNWDDINYPLEILNDAATKPYIAGTAFHCYAGDVSAMSQVYNAHPDAGIYFTECSGGDFAPDYGANLSWNSENLLMGATRNWAKAVLFWNLALDENSGPKNGGCDDCRAVVTINSSTKTVTKNEEYVLLGHITKFVQSGAKRIETRNARGEDISQVAFKNPTGSIVVVVFNHKEEPQKVQFQYQQDDFNYEIESGMLATFVIEN